MAFERVKEYLTERGYGERITVHDAPCDTVPNAARMIGCEEARIAKTMSLLVDEQPIVIVTAGDARIDNAKYKAHFHKKAKMIPWDQVEAVVGHEPGGVCAFALNDGVTAYVDVALRRFDEVHSAAGAPHCTVRLTPEEIKALSGAAEWVDVCKDWNAEA